MTDAAVTELALQMMIAGAKLAAPMLITALVVGFAVSLFQAVTQLQDSTLAFVPKIIAVGIVLLLAGNWMLQELVSFTKLAFGMLPTLLG
jgi:flagellar biosynthesis protein FliQ